MSRAGREPTEDVKRHLVAACKEVGLAVASARMHLVKEAGVRVVYAEASPEDWQHETSMLCVLATVPVTGEWPEFVDIRCSATEEDPVMSIFTSPHMKGRGRVPLPELVEQLRETLDEREKVVAAAKLGVTGPYRFERSVWERLDFLAGTASS